MSDRPTPRTAKAMMDQKLCEMVDEIETLKRELADARDKTADALQGVDLRTLDFERMKKGRDVALEAIEYIAYAGLSSRHMVDYAIEFLKRNKSSVSFPRDRYEKLCEAIAEIETLRRERNQAQKCAKVPELVAELKQGLDEAREENKKLREALLRVRTWGISSKNFSATDSYKMAEWIDDGCAGELPTACEYFKSKCPCEVLGGC
jgi:hypothetical protein